MKNLNEAVARLEQAYTAGMDEEYRDDLRTVLDALSAQPDAGSGGDARAQFEVSAKKHGLPLRREAGKYYWGEAQVAWEIWQAALAARLRQSPR